MWKSPIRRGEAAAEGAPFNEALSPAGTIPRGRTLYFKCFSI